MSLSDWFSQLCSHQSVHYTAAAVSSDSDPVVLQAGQHYIRLRLAEMYLKDDRKLFRSYVPVVSSVVSLQFGSNSAQQLADVAGPLSLNLSEDVLGRGVETNYHLTNLVPYKGGTVSVSAALLAYESKDYFSSFLKLANGVAGILTTGQLSSYLKVADTAVSGIQDLLDGADKEVYLVYHNEYGGSDSSGGVSLKSGYTAVIGADKTSFDTSKLYVKDSSLLYGNTKDNAQPLTGYDYMLLAVESAVARDDFREFAGYSTMLSSALEKGITDQAAGETIIESEMIAVFKSDDLTYVDKTRVAAALKAEYDQRLSQVSSLKGLGTGESGDDWLNCRTRAMDPGHIFQQIQPLTENRSGEEAADLIVSLICRGEIG
jgi:hypothetical protein